MVQKAGRGSGAHRSCGGRRGYGGQEGTDPLKNIYEMSSSCQARSQKCEKYSGNGLLGEGLGAVGRKFEAQGPIACAAA